MRTFNLYGFKAADDSSPEDIKRKAIPEWRLNEAIAWIIKKDIDTLLIDIRTDQNPSSFGPMICHHTCSDPHCPGGCDE